jgi:hypothetical protein
MAKEKKFIQMVQYMKEILKIIWPMVKGKY